MNSHRETEIKLRVSDLSAIRRRLRELGARAGKRVHEMNTLFDTRASTLRKRGHLLRLRRADGVSVVTWKGPGQPSRSRSRYKVREEREWKVRRPMLLVAELAQRGLRPSFRYEKFRTEFRLTRDKGAKVLLDETPIGYFLELEGSRRQIDRAARQLGHSPEDYLTSSYGALYLAYCRRHGRRPTNMLFRRPAKRPAQRKK